MEEPYEGAVVAGEQLRHLRRQTRDCHENVWAAEPSCEEQLHQVAGRRGGEDARLVHGRRDE
eukprot:5105763-Heterocapsa_arctica.AAC.1